ncbi:MAG TPA: hypothetical protein VL091_11190 [Marinobacter sp.]|nr:hypothetical protein [Marinobacter sp.]
MSLLNDALRAAEQRQNRPEMAAAYVGQSPSRRRPRRWLVPFLFLIIAILAVVVFYGFFSRDSGNAPLIEVAVADVAGKESVPPRKSNADNQSNDAEIPKAASVEVAPLPELPMASLPTNTVQPAGAGRSTSKSRVEKAATTAEPVPVTETVSEVSAIPAIKQQRETPETVDLRASRQISKLLQVGDIAAAEALMGQLEKTQAAPVSREVLARNLLMQGMPEQALRWLAVAETDKYPALRLLKSRGLLSTGDLSGAVATLLQDVPPVTGHIEYRVTLATLLQQSGQSLESARQWSALIAVDDGRAAWWVGLAIALESQGEVGAAVRAYGQAEQLPGLSPSLSDYVRERMHKLQAG